MVAAAAAASDVVACISSLPQPGFPLLQWPRHPAQPLIFCSELCGLLLLSMRTQRRESEVYFPFRLPQNSLCKAGNTWIISQRGRKTCAYCVCVQIQKRRQPRSKSQSRRRSRPQKMETVDKFHLFIIIRRWLICTRHTWDFVRIESQVRPFKNHGWTVVGLYRI